MATMTVLTILMKITVFKSAMNKEWFQTFNSEIRRKSGKKSENPDKIEIKIQNFNVRTESVFQNHFFVMDNTTALGVLTSLIVQVRFFDGTNDTFLI